jgi:(2Fe-2S) ferredoxin
MMKSLDELRSIREKIKSTSRLPEHDGEAKVIVGMGTCGIAAGARNVLLAIMDELASRDTDSVTVTQTGCLGMCEKEPLVEVQTSAGRTLYGYVNAERARRIIANHVLNGEPIVEWMINRE